MPSPAATPRPSPRAIVPATLLTATVLTVLWLCTAEADDEPAAPRLATTPAALVGVTVPGDAAVVERFAALDRAIAKGRWDDGAKALGFLAARSEMLGPDPDDERLYRPCAELVRRRVTAAPPPLRAAFVRRFEGEGRRALARARASGSPQHLVRVASSYRALEGTDRALLVAASGLVEAGSLRAARSVLRGLLVEELSPRVARRARDALDAVEGVLDRARPADPPHRALSASGVASATLPFPDLAGATARSGVPTAASARFAVAEVRSPDSVEPRASAVPGSDLVLIHTGSELRGFDLVAGKVVWRVAAPAGASRLEGRAGRIHASQRLPPTFGVRVERDVAFATLAPPPSPLVPTWMRVRWPNPVPADASVAAVVAVSARDGALSWRRSLDQIGGGLVAVGAPEPIPGDAVAVAAFSAASPEQAWVVALDRATGALRWAARVARSERLRWTATQLPDVLPHAIYRGLLSLRPPVAAISARGDDLVVTTNAGALASLDPETGAIRWLRLHDRSIVDEQRRFRATRERQRVAWSKRVNEPDEWSPPLLLDDVLVHAPTDSARVELIRIDDGVRLATTSRGGRLDGVAHGRVVLTGVSGVATATLPALAPGWHFETRAALGRTAALPGRALVVSRPGGLGAVLVPSLEGIVLASPGDVRVVASLAKEDAIPGELLIAGDRLVWVTARSVTIWPIRDR